MAGIAAGLPAGARAEFAFSPPHTLAELGAFAPDLAADSEGRTTIVWEEMDEDGVTRLIQATRLRADGTLEPVRTLSSMTSGPNCSCPQVAVDLQGRATVAWIAGISPSDRERVQAIQLGADGVPLGPVKTLSPAAEEASQHELAIDSEDRATLVWRINASADRVESARLLPDGTAEPAQTISEPGIDSRAPSLAIDQEDRVVVVWPSTDGLQLVRLGSDGVSGAVQTILPPTANAGVPHVVVDSQGGATVAFWRFPGLDSKAIRVEADGTVGPVLSLSAESEQTFEPWVAIDSIDRVTAVWADFSEQIKTARIEADGTVGPVRLVSDPEAGRVGGPQVAIDAQDRAVVVWAHSPPTFTEPLPAPECEEIGFEPESDVVKAAFIGNDGIPGPPYAASAVGEQSISPALATDALGRVTVAWHSFDGSYFCEGADNRLQMSWGPWSEVVIDPPPPTEPTPPAEPSPPPPASRHDPSPAPTLRLANRAVVRGRFVVAHAACLAPAGSACDGHIKLLSRAKNVVAFGSAHVLVGIERAVRLRLSAFGRRLLEKRSSRRVRVWVKGSGVTGGELTVLPPRS